MSMPCQARHSRTTQEVFIQREKVSNTEVFERIVEKNPEKEAMPDQDKRLELISCLLALHQNRAAGPAWYAKRCELVLFGVQVGPLCPMSSPPSHGR
jgi:hypothetical protein